MQDMGDAELMDVDETPQHLAAMLEASPPSEACKILNTIIKKLRAIPGVTAVSTHTAGPSLSADLLSKALQPWFCLEQSLVGLLARLEPQVSSVWHASCMPDELAQARVVTCSLSVCY